MRPRLKKMIWIAPAAIVGIALFIFIGGEIVLHLWNWLLPPLFGWRLHHLLAGGRPPCLVPDPLRRRERPGVLPAPTTAVAWPSAGNI